MLVYKGAIRETKSVDGAGTVGWEVHFGPAGAFEPDNDVFVVGVVRCTDPSEPPFVWTGAGKIGRPPDVEAHPLVGTVQRPLPPTH